MSAPSTSNVSQDESQSAALARDAYFSGALEPADEIPTAEHAPPICPVTAPPEGDATRQGILNQMLRLELLLGLWHLQSGEVAEFLDAHPELAEIVAAASDESSAPCPAPVTDEEYLSQVALQLFGNQAA